jgi:hydrogenase maturation protease
VSSHGVDIATVLALGEALDRMPADVVLFAIEVTETGYGVERALRWRPRYRTQSPR